MKMAASTGARTLKKMRRANGRTANGYSKSKQKMQRVISVYQ
jgi:hypothetical protein